MPSLLILLRKGGELVSCNNIKGGFSFCGIEIGTLGLTYVPENENTYVYKPSDGDVHEETFAGHHGGYFYGVTRQPKEFVLRCYFEDSLLDKGIMEQVYYLFRQGKSGKLVFDRRPWCYYYATVTSSPVLEITNQYNGLVTVTMKAYYPYARSDSMYLLAATISTSSDKKYEYSINTTALFDKLNMAPLTSFTNLTERTSIILNNPGTEPAQVSLTLSGDAGLGVVIKNHTTNQECRIIAMDKEHTADVNKAVYVDGISGKTSLINVAGAPSPTPAFVYHDYGFIELAPSYPAVRNTYVQKCEDDIVTLYNTLYKDVAGDYIYITGEWHKIIEQIDSHALRLEHPVTVVSERTMITKMNEIEIIPDDTMDLTQITFSYKPTFA